MKHLLLFYVYTGKEKKLIQRDIYVLWDHKGSKNFQVLEEWGRAFKTLLGREVE